MPGRVCFLEREGVRRKESDGEKALTSVSPVMESRGMGRKKSER